MRQIGSKTSKLELLKPVVVEACGCQDHECHEIFWFAFVSCCRGRCSSGGQTFARAVETIDQLPAAAPPFGGSAMQLLDIKDQVRCVACRLTAACALQPLSRNFELAKRGGKCLLSICNFGEGRGCLHWLH